MTDLRVTLTHDGGLLSGWHVEVSTPGSLTSWSWHCFTRRGAERSVRRHARRLARSRTVTRTYDIPTEPR